MMREFAEQTAAPTRMMYAAPNRRTSHRLARLDVAVPSWMRAPGEMPGMYAHEVAMDELAVACGLDPIVLRERNEPDVDPETGKPFNDGGCWSACTAARTASAGTRGPTSPGRPWPATGRSGPAWRRRPTRR